MTSLRTLLTVWAFATISVAASVPAVAADTGSYVQGAPPCTTKSAQLPNPAARNQTVPASSSAFMTTPEPAMMNVMPRSGRGETMADYTSSLFPMVPIVQQPYDTRPKTLALVVSTCTNPG